MNIEFHILIGQPRAKEGEQAKRELEIIGSYPSRSDLSKARGKVKPEDFTFTGEINTSSSRLRNRRVLTLPPKAAPPAVVAETTPTAPATPAPAVEPPKVEAPAVVAPSKAKAK